MNGGSCNVAVKLEKLRTHPNDLLTSSEFSIRCSKPNLTRNRRSEPSFDRLTDLAVSKLPQGHTHKSLTTIFPTREPSRMFAAGAPADFQRTGSYFAEHTSRSLDTQSNATEVGLTTLVQIGSRRGESEGFDLLA